MAGKLTGAEETAREGYRELLQDAATAQSQHPLVYGAGNVGGKVARTLLFDVASGQGCIRSYGRQDVFF